CYSCPRGERRRRVRPRVRRPIRKQVSLTMRTFFAVFVSGLLIFPACAGQDSGSSGPLGQAGNAGAGGSAQGGSAQGGSARGGSAQGGSAQGGSAQGGAAGDA